MRTIAIFNPKGGVSKTTTAVNLSAGLSRQDKKVLLIDLDPQGSVDLALKINSEITLTDVLSGTVPVQQAIHNLGKNLDVIISNDQLLDFDRTRQAEESEGMVPLKKILSSIKGYDYLIIDCSPSQGILNQRVLSFCKEVFVPTSTDYVGFDALKRIQKIVDNINNRYMHDLKITKIIPTLYDRRNKICKDTLVDIQSEFPELTGYPIRINSKLKEAPKHGKSIFSYDKRSFGAEDYGKLSEEVIAMEDNMMFSETEKELTAKISE